MLYVLIDKLPADILSYIRKNYLPSKKCKTCYCEIKWNSKRSRSINNWTYCSDTCYNFI